MADRVRRVRDRRLVRRLRLRRSREPVGWDEASSDLSGTARRRDGSDVGWIDAGIAPPPNLATKLVARDAPPVRIVEEFVPKSVTNPAPGTYVFDFGQNFAGWPQLNLTTPVPAGTVIRMSPAEGLANDGSGLVNQSSLGPGGRGTDMFNTYTAAGGGPETWHPDFQYFGMQFLQVTGLPEGYGVDEQTRPNLHACEAYARTECSWQTDAEVVPSTWQPTAQLSAISP